jgi:ssDNA-binding Zn-finger/Zn-ribbon topoisomerase 1
MKCPKCETEMGAGFFSNGLWLKGEPKFLFGKGFTKLTLTPYTTREYTAWYCPNCKNMELRGEEE